MFFLQKSAAVLANAHTGHTKHKMSFSAKCYSYWGIMSEICLMSLSLNLYLSFNFDASCRLLENGFTVKLVLVYLVSKQEVYDGVNKPPCQMYSPPMLALFTAFATLN